MPATWRCSARPWPTRSRRARSPTPTGANLDHIGATYYSLTRLGGEDDERYRERLAGAVERYAVGLSGPWYESIARGVEGVADARATTPQAGTVRIYVLANETLTDDGGMTLYENGIPNAALLAAVKAAVTADDARQQTDTVEVQACTRQLFDVTVALTLLTGPDLGAGPGRGGSRPARRRPPGPRASAPAVSKELIAGAAVDVAAASAAVITLQTVDGAGGVAAVDSIAGMDSVAPQPRNLTVTTT